MFSRYLLILVFLTYFNHYCLSLQLKVKCDGPIVLGATVNCTTWVYNDDMTPAKGRFRYSWEDDALPANKKLVESSSNNSDTWLVTYNSSTNSVGGYIVRVDVCKYSWYMCSSSTSNGTLFEITDTLNGQIALTQGNESRDGFVSTREALKNTISLKSADQAYISKAPKVLSYWFVDCIYYGITTDLAFHYNFTKPDQEHVIESLVVADFTPLPPPTTPPPPTTSSTTPTTTTSTTAHPNSTTAPTTPKSVVKRETNSAPPEGKPSNLTSKVRVWKNGVLVPYNVSFPYICNGTAIARDGSKVYGYFQRVVTTKDPVSNVTVSGNNWLQHGELLKLNVNCKGSDRMQFCYFFRPGLYNVTGNETCAAYSDLDKCDFPIQRYFQDQHTVIIIIKNEVNKKVTSVAVTIYKAKQQAQLSVVVVPVAFSLVAVVTIVFGVAYYLQNRSRFTVEVADFDFGQKYADMEYKTFKDRLKDSIVNAFTRDPMPSGSDAPVWPPGHKYGSMT